MFLRFVGILFFFPFFWGGGLAFTYLMELDLMTQSKLSVKWDLNGAAKRDVERKRRGRGKDEGEGGGREKGRLKPQLVMARMISKHVVFPLRGGRV